MKALVTAWKRKRAIRALRRAILRTFGTSVSDIVVTDAGTRSTAFNAQFEGFPIQGALTARTVIEPTSRGYVTFLQYELRLAPAGVIRGWAHDSMTLRRLIAAT